MADRSDPIAPDETVDERLVRAEERLGALEREVELLREQLRSLSNVVGAGDDRSV